MMTVEFITALFLIPSDFVVHSFRPPMEEAMSRLSPVSSNGTDMRCSAYLFICGVQEYVESMARAPSNSIQQG